MKDLLMIATICTSMLGIILYVTADTPRQSRVQGCYGECYEEYQRVHGTLMEQMAKQAEAEAADPYSSIRGLWAGCAACHGQVGQGMGAFPRLAGHTKEYITDRLYAYKNRETIGAMSSTMWAQAGMLSDSDIETIGKFIQQELK